MGDKDEEPEKGRLRWLMIGIITGMLIFPKAAGLPFRASWRLVGERAADASAKAYHTARPVVRAAWMRIRRALEYDDPEAAEVRLRELQGLRTRQEIIDGVEP